MGDTDTDEVTLTLAETQAVPACSSSSPRKRSHDHSSARSEDDRRECNSSDGGVVDAIYVASPGTKTCLDDLVRRLEARQQEGEGGATSVTPSSTSPAKKPRTQGACDLHQEVEQVGGVLNVPQV